jgi:outer membrane receptor protein involved in Fe transport
MGRDAMRRYRKGMRQLILFFLSLAFCPAYLAGQVKKDSTVVLKEVSVTAVRPLIKSDLNKISYDVSADPDAKSMSVLEMLRKVPVVTIEGSETIKVNGKSDFKVYVNGKPNTMMSNKPAEILKSMPASTIKKIEVITNPGAKYDAEGTAGILNIVTESNSKMEGYNLNLSAGVMNIAQSGNIFGLVKVGKLTMSLSNIVSYSKLPKRYQETERTTYASQAERRLLSHSDYKTKAPARFFDFQSSYEFDKHNLLSISLGIEYYRGKNWTDMHTEMYDKDGGQTYSFLNNHFSENKLDAYYGGADYQHTFGAKGGNITFSYRYSTVPSTLTSSSLYSNIKNYPNIESLKDLQSASNLHADEQTGQVDYTVTMNKLHTLSVGAKYIYRINKSNNNELSRVAASKDAFVLGISQSLSYKQITDIAAGYVEYQINIGKLSGETGIRYEHSSQKVIYPGEETSGHTNFSTDFDDIVPSMSLGYNFGDTKMLKFSYDMRISRPNIWNLNPYIDRSDPIVIKRGNPNLKTSTSHNFSLSFNSFSRKLSVNTTLGFDLSNNGIISYSYLGDVSTLQGPLSSGDEGSMISTFGNILRQKNVYANLFLNYMLTHTTTVNVNASGAYSDFKSKEIASHNYGFSGNLSAFVQQRLPWKMLMSLGYSNMSRSLNLQGHTDGTSVYRLMFMRSFLKEDRLSVTIYGNNLFTNELRIRSVTKTADFSNCFTNIRHDYRIFGFSVSLRFGKLHERVKHTVKSIQNDDVIQDGNPMNNGN